MAHFELLCKQLVVLSEDEY